jgi:DmsE family decaheme c-type cytochrome
MGRRILSTLGGLAALLWTAGGAAVAAEPPGTECAACHEPVVKAFGTNIHAKAAFFGAQAGCATCHAGAAEHAESGEPSKVVNLAKVDAEKASAACLSCHVKDRAQTWWRGSSHEAGEVGCTSCHSVHGGQPRLLAQASESALCFTCHLDVRADTLKRSKHPLRNATLLSGEGKMTCSSCHNPHGGRSRALIDAASINDKCYQCHFEKRAPVLWEHSPVKEDCLVCHTPHGSSNDKMLVTRVPRLCQECHMQGRHQSGTLAANSAFAINRSCLNCHPQVHGSNNPSGTVLQR